MSEAFDLILEHPEPRLDRFLTERWNTIPRSRWEAWIREGQVSVNGETATKPGTKLRAGDRVEGRLPDLPPPAIHLEAEALDLPTLFEDSKLWIVDKPSGMVVHPGPGHPKGTVVNALLHRLGAGGRGLEEPHADDEAETGDEVPDAPWPGLVHRLDRYTTGCLCLAKDAESQRAIQAQFKARTVEKRYLALVRMGRRLPEIGSLLIDEPILRHRVERLKMTIAAAGRPSQTRVRLLGKAAGLALIECELLTGRTHQIRVHLGHIGSPLLGDPLYGGAGRWQDARQQPIEAPNPVLHAWKLSVDHPVTGARIDAIAPLPEAFTALLERLELPIPS
ncbi:MAG: RluA family pseudouridine synthase [Acidobacteria bacterium]|nr:RluA family pseudouridine synthase [Acidobacteriota bacterium]